MTIESMTEFLGWVTVINIAILLFSTFAVIVMRKWITSVHAGLFGLNEKDLGYAYFQYLAQFKIAIIVLNIAPYIALKIMA